MTESVKVLGQSSGEGWQLWHGDCVEVIHDVPSNSVDFEVFSPPFESLYTYSNSARDMGNCRTSAEFAAHFAHLTPELYRVMKPGRLLAVHCMLIPTSKARDGVIGLRDFRGDLIRLFQADGFVFHSETTIWKDPVTAMQRTKALGLLHKQIKKDSTRSRTGIPDYLCVFVKPGDNPVPVAHTDESFPVARWQRYASPVWATSHGDEDEEGFLTFRSPRKGDVETESSGIDPGDTLQFMAAREGDDERHICPLQLGAIRRAMRLWTNPGDVVLSPFAGIGSEGYVAVQEGRKFVGIELKESYYKMAARNLKAAEPTKERSLFDLMTPP